MNVQDIQQAVERLMASFPHMRLPKALRGLEPLAHDGRCPRVEIRGRSSGRKLRCDADVGYFDPDVHEVIIRFGPAETSSDDDGNLSPKAQAQFERRIGRQFGKSARERRARFAPMRIRGGAVSDTVLDDRR